MTDWVPLGRVARPHGVRGGVRIHPLHEGSDILAEGLALRIDGKDHVLSSVYGPWLVKFKGIETREEVALLNGKYVEVRREDFAALDDDEFYLTDLLGAAVVDEDGQSIGTIKGFGDNGAQTLAEVKTATGVFDVPFIAPILVRVDTEAKIVVLRPPQGLFGE